MPETIIRVAAGGSVIGPKGVVYLPGQRISTTVFSRSSIAEHLKSGYFVASVGGRMTVTEAMSSLPPGTQISGAMDSEGRILSQWNLDPDGLRGMELEALNVLVSERDRSLDPFDNAEEAAEFLSQDYVAPKAE